MLFGDRCKLGPVILTLSFGRRTSWDTSDSIALVHQKRPTRGLRASPHEFLVRASPEILCPKEELRTTGSNPVHTPASVRLQYDSPIGGRPVLMRVGNIASTVENQAFCREYDRNLRLRVRREIPSTRAAFCWCPEVPRSVSKIRSFSTFPRGVELLLSCSPGRDS